MEPVTLRFMTTPNQLSLTNQSRRLHSFLVSSSSFLHILFLPRSHNSSFPNHPLISVPWLGHNDQPSLPRQSWSDGFSMAGQTSVTAEPVLRGAFSTRSLHGLKHDLDTAVCHLFQILRLFDGCSEQPKWTPLTRCKEQKCPLKPLSHMSSTV